MPYAYRERGALRIHYELEGDPKGPPILLIRGLSRSSRYWYDVRPILAERGFRVLVVDNRGVGRTDSRGPGFSTADMADDVAAVLDQSEVHAAHVFGISLGGMIAMQLAIRHPGRVRRLVLGSTTFGGKERVPVPGEVIRDLVRSSRMSTSEAIRFTTPLTLDGEFLARRPEVIDEWIAIAESEKRDRLALLGQLVAAARHDASRDVRFIRSPTLVVTGDRDRLIPMDNSVRLSARIPGAELRVLSGAGHDFPTERPEETAALLEGWTRG